MAKAYKYEVELQDPPNVWLVFKEEFGHPETRIAYQVELHHYEKEAHRCSCEYGVHQKWEKGKIIKRCKHIEMVLDEEFRRAERAKRANQ